MGGLPSVITMSIRNNPKLSGTIPPQISQALAMTIFRLEGVGQIYGTIPVRFSVVACALFC
jgi:hypothetical protein